MRSGRLLLVVAVFALVTTAASAAPERLVISGAFHTSSAQTVAGDNGGCGFRPDRTLILSSAAMRIGRGPTVARVSFFVRRFRGLGRYNATAPAPYHRTAVGVATADTATKGVASGFYLATTGSLSIVRARNVGRRGHWGFLSGTVQARLRLQGGSKRLRLNGTWHCGIEPASNGLP